MSTPPLTALGPEQLYGVSADDIGDDADMQDLFGEDTLDTDPSLVRPIRPLERNDNVSTFGNSKKRHVLKDGRVSTLAEYLCVINGKPLRFEGEHEDRSYLRAIYDMASIERDDTGSRNIVLCCSRQTEKCVWVDAQVLLPNGSRVSASTVQAGDTVMSYDTDTATFVPRRVTWVSPRRHKPGVVVKTRIGHRLGMALTHPIYTSSGWTTGSDLVVGTRVAAVRRAGSFGTGTLTVDQAAVMGYLIGDGSIPDAGLIWTQNEDRTATREHFINTCARLGVTARPVTTDPRSIHLNGGKQSPIVQLLQREGLLGHRSATKFVPPSVWNASREATVAFLNALWACDGSVLQGFGSATAWNLVYCSISERLIRDMQALLWKFGIPSTINNYEPEVYVGTGKLSWLLRIETREGIRTFVREIGALGKTDALDPDTMFVGDENNNRDTIPQDLAQAAINQCYGDRVRNSHTGWSLRRFGLNKTLSYAPQRAKLGRYIEAFTAAGEDVGGLQRLVQTDVMWDVIEELEYIPDLECIDYSVEGTATFVADGIVNHNSTSCVCKSVTLAYRIPHYKVLYVAPRQDQVRVFSNQRFNPICQESPVIRQEMLSTKNIWQVTQRHFNNGSIFNFASCYLTADAARGISADLLDVDEFQDIAPDNVQILEESQSHSSPRRITLANGQVVEFPMRQNLYTGTPKSWANVLTKRFKQSTMFEWVVKCENGICGHWNRMLEEIITPTHYQCVKCGRPLRIGGGHWEADNPSMMQTSWGFRISQLMVPWITPREMWAKQNNPLISRKTFYNESLGLPYDDGEIVLTEQVMARACDVTLPAAIQHDGGPPYTNIQNIPAETPLVGGVDWGSSDAKKPSFTVMAVGAMVRGVFRILFLKRFSGKSGDIVQLPAKINEIARRAGVAAVGCDYGFGFMPNRTLISTYGWSVAPKAGTPTMMEMQYVPNARFKARWLRDGSRYLLHRNTVMSEFIDQIRRGFIRFPAFHWMQQEDLLQDFTNVVMETHAEKDEYKYDRTDHDDAFHACLYAYFAHLQLSGLLVPTRTPSLTTATTEPGPYFQHDLDQYNEN